VTQPFGEQLKSRIGSELHVTDWFEVTQADIDAFAALTHDWDYMHNDPERAAKGPWGGTIAHGYFLVSLISHFMSQAGFPMVETPDERMLNYGLDRVRFIDPVLIGDRVRARLVIRDVTERRPGVNLAKLEVKYETERQGDKPHMIAEVLMLVVHGEAVHEAR
jgi:acyl dehydratase